MSMMYKRLAFLTYFVSWKSKLNYLLTSDEFFINWVSIQWWLVWNLPNIPLILSKVNSQKVEAGPKFIIDSDIWQGRCRFWVHFSEPYSSSNCKQNSWINLLAIVTLLWVIILEQNKDIAWTYFGQHKYSLSVRYLFIHISELIITQCFHWSAVKPLNQLSIFSGIRPILVGVTKLLTQDCIHNICC